MNTIQNHNCLKNPTSSDFFILDIDSTLVTTHQRNQAILDHFISKNKELFPQDCEQLSQARCQLGDYGIESSLKRIGFTPTVPKVSEDLMKFWRQNFFSNDFLFSDQPTEGAVQWVSMLNKYNIDFVYLTARHKKACGRALSLLCKNWAFQFRRRISF